MDLQHASPYEAGGRMESFDEEENLDSLDIPSSLVPGDGWTPVAGCSGQ